jgi:hypothetical protein
MHGNVAWDRRHATSIRGNGGVSRHTTIITQQWCEIGDVAIPRQQRKKYRATNGLFCTSEKVSK